jgi:hypothetical protein
MNFEKELKEATKGRVKYFNLALMFSYPISMKRKMSAFEFT